MTDPCYRDRNNGVYYTRNAHRPDCTDPDCRGCKPCPADQHCTATRSCTAHTGPTEQTCPRCIGRARWNLNKIADLAALMYPAALNAGINSEAANLAGPAADPVTWSIRKIRGRNGGPWHLSLIEDDDEHHPRLVTGRWVHMLGEAYGHPAPTGDIAANVDYLDRQLVRLAQDPDQDFPGFAREIKKCRQHLEAVLRDSAKPDRGAPCPECTSDQHGVGPRLVRQYGHWCDDEDCERVHYSTRFDADTCEDVADTSGDWWVCPRDRDHAWSHEDYSKWVEERRAHVRRVRA